MTLNDLVKLVPQLSFYPLRKLAEVKSVLSRQQFETVIHAFISSRLDYCNSLCFESGTRRRCNPGSLCTLESILNVLYLFLSPPFLSELLHYYAPLGPSGQASSCSSAPRDLSGSSEVSGVLSSTVPLAAHCSNPLLLSGIPPSLNLGFYLLYCLV